MRALQRRVLFALPALAYMALIFGVSSGPISSETVKSVPDYFLHSAAYAILYGLLFFAFHEGLATRPGRGGLWAPLLVTLLYGISDEYHQSFVPSRDATVIDVVSDFVGGLAALAFFAAICRRKERSAAGKPRPVQPRERDAF